MVEVNHVEGWESRFDSAFAYLPIGTAGQYYIKQWIAHELSAKDVEIAELKERLAHPNEVKCTRCGNWGRGRHRIGPSTLCPDCAFLFSKKLKVVDEHS